MARTLWSSPQDMRDLVNYCDVPGYEVVEDVVTGTSRWSTNYRLVFKHDGTYYETTYSRGATESQDEQPFDDMYSVESTEVVPTQVTITKYLPA